MGRRAVKPPPKGWPRLYRSGGERASLPRLAVARCCMQSSSTGAREPPLPPGAPSIRRELGILSVIAANVTGPCAAAPARLRRERAYSAAKKDLRSSLVCPPPRVAFRLPADGDLRPARAAATGVRPLALTPEIDVQRGGEGSDPVGFRRGDRTPRPMPDDLSVAIHRCIWRRDVPRRRVDEERRHPAGLTERKPIVGSSGRRWAQTNLRREGKSDDHREPAAGHRRRHR